MKVALLNPPWSFEGSVYFGCREPHLPLELKCAQTLMEAAGHDVALLDAHLFGMSDADLAAELEAFRPELSVIATAPTYLFWRCAPPELRVPRATLRAIRPFAGRTVAIGPHASTTPAATLRKLGVDGAVMGEPEEALALIADGAWEGLRGLAHRDGSGEIRVNGGPLSARFVDLPPLRWPKVWLDAHRHHHHRFDLPPEALDRPGAEVEASRGCPYRCTFCAKENFRDKYRRRPPAVVAAEVEGLLRQGVGYVYFVDEIFLPNRPLLEALLPLRERHGLAFGVQTRIDLWKPDTLELLGKAGCVSIEAGVESLTESGRERLDKACKLSTDELAELLVLAKRHVPFVQANLLESEGDDEALVRAWRENLRAQGVWANDPVPLFPYPGSPEYRRRFGLPDDHAWERAVDAYLEAFDEFSDVQEGRPLRLRELEKGVPV